MSVQIITGDCRSELAKLPAESVNCCVTSPPYFGLRDYGVDGQIGLENTPDAFVAELVSVFREVRRVLRDDGVCWLNLGDSYAANRTYQVTDRKAGDVGNFKGSAVPDGLKPKDLIGIPWRVAFALQADGWYLRQDIIWSKPNPMPESVQDRCTKAHEYVFLLSKSPRYWYDADAIAEPAVYSGLTGQDESGFKNAAAFNGKHSANPEVRNERGRGGVNAFRGQGANRDNESGKANRTGRDLQNVGTGVTRNARSVWTIATAPFAEAHFATFPPELAERCIKAGCPEGGVVLDPFGGAGTTGLVADRLRRNAVLIELNPEYAAMAKRRIEKDAGLFAEVAA